MSEEEAGKEKTKQVRIGGDDFWGPYDAIEDIKNAREMFQSWLKGQCKHYNIYTDQVENALTGKYRLDDGVDHSCVNPKCGMRLNTGTVKRLPLEFVEEAEKEWAKVDSVVKKANELTIQIAKKYGVHPDLIDVQTGVIKDNNIETAKPVQNDDSGDNVSE